MSSSAWESVYFATVQVKAAILAASAKARGSIEDSAATSTTSEYSDLTMLQAKPPFPLDNVIPTRTGHVKMKKGWVSILRIKGTSYILQLCPTSIQTYFL